jgi:hypothetical protein
MAQLTNLQHYATADLHNFINATHPTPPNSHLLTAHNSHVKKQSGNTSPPKLKQRKLFDPPRAKARVLRNLSQPNNLSRGFQNPRPPPNVPKELKLHLQPKPLLLTIHHDQEALSPAQMKSTLSPAQAHSTPTKERMNLFSRTCHGEAKTRMETPFNGD